jgi:hypothetical protein
MLPTSNAAESHRRIVRALITASSFDTDRCHEQEHFAGQSQISKKGYGKARPEVKLADRESSRPPHPNSHADRIRHLTRSGTSSLTSSGARRESSAGE